MKSWQYSGESSSSVSNLSAFAPPFTVGPFAPNPNSNPYEPLLGLPSNSSMSSWPSPSPHLSAPDWSLGLSGREFDSMNYPTGHEYLTQAAGPAATEPFPYGHFSDGPRTNVDEVRPYYPQYYYSRLETDQPSELTNQRAFDGLSSDKNQMVSRPDNPVLVSQKYGDTANREYPEPVKLEGRYCIEQGNAADYCSYMSQGAGSGAHPSLGFSIRGEASNDVNLFDRGKQDFPKLQEAVHAKSLADNPEFTGLTSPTMLNLKYSPMPPAALSEGPSLDLFSYLTKDQMKRQNGSNPSGGNFADVLPSFSTRPQASAPVFEAPSGNQGSGIVSTGDHFSDYNHCSVKDTRAAENPEKSILFGEARIRFCQGYNDFTLGKSIDEDMLDENVVPNDSYIRPSRGNLGVEVPYMNRNFSSISSFEAFNGFNRAVDPPCWKGAPIGHYGSSSGPSDILAPKNISDPKEFDVLNPQGHQVFAQSANAAWKASSKGLDEHTPQRENLPQRNSVFHLEQPYDFNQSETEEESFHDAMEAVCPNTRQQNAHLNDLKGDSGFGTCQIKQNSPGHEVNSEERKLSGNEASDKGRSTMDDSNNGFSDVSVQCVEHVLSSPPVKEATVCSELYGDDLTKKTEVKMFVRMMHNLSELLMSGSSKGACDLGEEDCEFLKNATNNLILFCLENRHLAKRRYSKEPRITFMPGEVILGEFPGVHATLVEIKRAEVVGEMDKSHGKPVLIPAFVGGEKKHHEMCNYPEKKNSDFAGVIGQSSVTRDDQMSQSGLAEGPQVSNDFGNPEGSNNTEKHSSDPNDICKSSSDQCSLGILSDNVKNDKMTQAIKTILLENFHEEEEADPRVQLFKNLWLDAEAALCSMNYRARYDRVKFEMEKSKSHTGKEPSKSTAAAMGLSNSQNTVAAKDLLKNHDNLDVLGQNFYPVNDVMERFKTLKDRESKLNFGSSTKAIYGLQDELASEKDKCTAIPDPAPVNLPVKASSNEAEDMESLVLSRLSVLRQREEKSNSIVNPVPEPPAKVNPDPDLSQESGTEAEEPHETVNLEPSILSRLSILLQRDNNLGSMAWDSTPQNLVNLETAVQQDYFPIPSMGDTMKGFSSGFTNRSAVPESQMTGGSVFRDFTSSSDWEHVRKEEV